MTYPVGLLPLNFRGFDSLRQTEYVQAYHGRVAIDTVGIASGRETLHDWPRAMEEEPRSRSAEPTHCMFWSSITFRMKSTSMYGR